MSPKYRAAALRLLGIDNAAAWCWSDANLREALTHGIRFTSYGVAILTEGVIQ